MHTVQKDQQFNLSLQGIKQCRELIEQKNYEQSRLLIDKVTHIQDILRQRDLSDVDLIKELSKFEVMLNVG